MCGGGGSRFFKGSLKRLNQKKKNSLFSPFSLNFNKKKKCQKAEPDVTTTELSAGDHFLLLACDGVWDVLTNQGAADVVSKELGAGKTPAQAAAALLDACLSPDPRATRGAG